MTLFNPYNWIVFRQLFSCFSDIETDLMSFFNDARAGTTAAQEQCYGFGTYDLLRIHKIRYVYTI